MPRNDLEKSYRSDRDCFCFVCFLGMSILITGAAGFIGTRLVSSLAEAAVGLDILPLSGLQVDICKFLDLSLALTPYLNQIEYVVHLAAKPGVMESIENPAACAEANIVGTINLLTLCRQMPRLRRILLASSSCAEQPICPYGVSKRSLELFAESLSSLWNLPVVALRFFSVYGDARRADMVIPTFIKNAKRGEPLVVYGDPSREFTHVDDIVAGIIHCMRIPYRGYEQFDLSTGQLVTVKSLAELIGIGCLIQQMPARAGERQEGTRASKLPTGWISKINIKAGLTDFY